MVKSEKPAAIAPSKEKKKAQSDKKHKSLGHSQKKTPEYYNVARDEWISKEAQPNLRSEPAAEGSPMTQYWERELMRDQPYNTIGAVELGTETTGIEVLGTETIGTETIGRETETLGTEALGTESRGAELDAAIVQHQHGPRRQNSV